MADKFYVTSHPDPDGEFRVVVVGDSEVEWVAIGTKDHCEERAKTLNAEAARQEGAQEEKRKKRAK